jgi:hypothetical protein
MRLLDLFSGTGSVANAAKERGWETTTLDRDLPADIKMDILNWDFKSFPKDSFDYIHASPPCTHYSLARSTAKTPRDIEGSNLIVAKTLEIINYFNPKFFSMENPQSGFLKIQPVVSGLKFTDVDYCKYGKPFRKRTRFWNNFSDKWKPREPCSISCPCENVIFDIRSGRMKHKVHAQLYPMTNNPYRISNSRSELYSIPSELVNEILELLETLNIQ